MSIIDFVTDEWEKVYVIGLIYWVYLLNLTISKITITHADYPWLDHAGISYVMHTCMSRIVNKLSF